MADNEREVTVLPIEEEDYSLSYATAQEEVEFQPDPFPGALRSIQVIGTTRPNFKTKEPEYVEQIEIRVKPETFETEGDGIPTWFDLPAKEPIVDPESGETRMIRPRPKKNTALGKFMEAIDTHIGPDPDTKHVDAEGNEVSESYTIAKLAKLVEVAKRGEGDFPLRATWQKRRVSFGSGKRVVQSGQKLFIVGQHPDVAGASNVGDFEPADQELVMSIYTTGGGEDGTQGRTDREIQQALGTLELPAHVYNAILSGVAKKELVGAGLLAKDSGTKRYMRAA